MKLIAVALLVCVSSFGGTPMRERPKLAPIALYLQYEQALPADVLEPLRAEVGAILAPGGFRFEWRDLRSAEPAAASAGLAVVTFRGTCDTNLPPRRMELETKALGYTSVTDGEILPFTTVDCTRTQIFLGSALLRLSPPLRQAALGRALGRVLAHELYHIFGNTQRHGHNGVAKESFSVRDLLAPTFEMDGEEFQVLQSSPAYSALSQSASQ